jgi:hypothetical protein
VPEQTFEKIARAELIPKMLLQSDKISRERSIERLTTTVFQSSFNDKNIIASLERLIKVVDTLPLKQEIDLKDKRDFDVELVRRLPKAINHLSESEV